MMAARQGHRLSPFLYCIQLGQTQLNLVGLNLASVFSQKAGVLEFFSELIVRVEKFHRRDCLAIER